MYVRITCTADSFPTEDTACPTDGPDGSDQVLIAHLLAPWLQQGFDKPSRPRPRQRIMSIHPQIHPQAASTVFGYPVQGGTGLGSPNEDGRYRHHLELRPCASIRALFRLAGGFKCAHRCDRILYAAALCAVHVFDTCSQGAECHPCAHV